MNVRELLGKHLALLLIADDENGEPEVMTVHGEVAERDGVMFLDRGLKGQLELRDEWHDRVRIANGEARTILESEYYLPLTVGTLPEDEDPASFEFTGITWLPPTHG